ncbi:MAG: hypothetical protein WKF43_00010 [Acidimicrobiales bacterium]
MFAFWQIAIAPLIEAVRARRLVVIGPIVDEQVEQMLDRLGPGTELHLIDPRAAAAPPHLAQAGSDRCFFHPGLSLDVLPALPPADVALIDGDHNWYTVFHELELLSATALEADRPRPVFVVPNVTWPYGHRDLYYDPARIPERYRQPHGRGGMHPDRPGLLPAGGLNESLHHAEQAGGPRNGVLSALEDFVATVDRPLQQVVLPFAYGLAIVAEHGLVDATPALADLLVQLESAEGREEQLRVSERVRIDAAIFEHNWVRLLRRRIEQGAGRYLDLVKSALLDEHYLDNEVRLEYLASLPAGATPDLSVLRDPPRLLPVRFQKLVRARQAGRSPDERRNVAYFPFTSMSRAQIEHLRAA